MKKIVALLLGMLVLLAACTAMAETVTVEPGEELSFDVSISSASGKSAKIGIETNDAPVSFVGAVGGNTNDTVPPQNFSDYFVVVNVDYITIEPDGSDLSGTVEQVRDLEDGVIGTVTIKVKDDAKPGTYTVEAYKKSGSVTVEGSVTFVIEEEEVSDRIPGDANDDGEVTTRDALLIMQWIAGFDVTINEENANCNGDDEVTTRDALMIMQWIAGFEVELV